MNYLAYFPLASRFYGATNFASGTDSVFEGLVLGGQPVQLV